ILVWFFSKPQYAADLSHHEFRVAERREADERCPIRKRRRDLARRLERESGLARTACPGQHNEPHVTAEEEHAQLFDLALASEKYVRSRREKRKRLFFSRRRDERAVVLKDAPLKRA